MIALAVGTPVIGIKDNGRAYLTKTRNEAWLTGRLLLVAVAGISGGYLASRCHIIHQDTLGLPTPE